MEGAIQTVVKAYLKSSKGGDLSGRDFDNLVKKQLGNVLSDTESKAKLKEMRKGLDENQDGKVSFEEYMTLIGYLATSMSDAKTRDAGEAAQPSATAASANSPPAQENNKAAPAAAAAAAAAPAEQPKVEEKEAAVALPEPVAAAVSAAAALVEEEKPKEKVEGAIASAVAEVDAKVEEATS